MKIFETCSTGLNRRKISTKLIVFPIEFIITEELVIELVVHLAFQMSEPFEERTTD